MICTFLKKSGADVVLIFFNGWGMDTTRLLTWGLDERDVMTVHDYTVLDLLPPVLETYREVHVVAWSLGVWAAQQVLVETQKRLTMALASVVAVNGTVTPISAATGIAPEVFRGTYENWLTEAAREKFNHRMHGSAETLTQRKPIDQRNELRALELQIAGAVPIEQLVFTQAIVGTRDRIFLPAAQRAAWQCWPAVEQVERSVFHDAFASVTQWREVFP